MAVALAKIRRHVCSLYVPVKAVVPIENRVRGMLQSRHWLYVHGSTESGGLRVFAIGAVAAAPAPIPDVRT